jgi:hypothetical protein
MTDEPSNSVTLGNIEAALSAYGVSLFDLKGLRVVPDRRGDRSSPMYLEAKVYLRNDDGERFIVRWPPDGCPVVAYERVQIPLSSLALTGEARPCDPSIHYYDVVTGPDGVNRDVPVARRASEIIQEQMVAATSTATATAS